MKEEYVPWPKSMLRGKARQSHIESCRKNVVEGTVKADATKQRTEQVSDREQH